MESPARMIDKRDQRGSKPDQSRQVRHVDDIEQIMEQMQTLNVERKEEEVHPVDEKTKNKLLRWLVDDVKLISNQVNQCKLMLDLPKYCRNGVLYGDLLNRLKGREEVIKGLHRTPKNMTAINANFDKVLGYLKQFPRFSSRYLWSQQKAIEGNADVIWGLLDDIWHWNFNKISAQDPAQRLKIAEHHHTEQRKCLSTSQSHNADPVAKNLTSSLSRTKQTEFFGTGPPKMRDYIKNGEKAAQGLRTSAQSASYMKTEVSGKKDNCSPKARKRRQNRQNAASKASTDQTENKQLNHNFHPRQHLQSRLSQERNSPVRSSNRVSSAACQPENQENYLSFGHNNNQQHFNHNNNNRGQELDTESSAHRRKQLQQHSNIDLTYFRQNSDVNRITPAGMAQQSQPQQMTQLSGPSRPPRVPHLIHNANMSELSTAVKSRQQQMFEVVPRLNTNSFGNVSNRSYSRTCQQEGVVNKYAVIESHRSQTSASKHPNLATRGQGGGVSPQRRQLSQFESPRSYGAAFRSHRQQTSASHERQSQNVTAFQRPPQSARNHPNNSSALASQNTRRRSTSRQKMVHIRTSLDHYGQDQLSQPSIGPHSSLTQQQQLLQQKQGALFKSMDSTISCYTGPPRVFTPKPGSDTECTVNDWLQFLKFHPFMSAEFEYVSLTEDPRRNGIFIAELVSYLVPQSALARSLSEGSLIKQRPKSVVECQQNWSNIFNVLYQLYGQIPSCQFANTRFLSKQIVQALMQGDKNYLYRLLHSLYESFYEQKTVVAADANECKTAGTLSNLNMPAGSACGHSSIGGSTSQGGHHNTSVVAPLAAPVEILSVSRRMTPSHSSSSMQQASLLQGGGGAGAYQDLELPYTPDELTQLDLSIIQWLKEIGQLKALSIDFQNVDSILDLQSVISNGVLLCALISRVFKVRITGVFKSPKTEATCLSNIRKAMKVLQTSRKMSQKFTWTEKQVFECKRSVILGLFEDIHRVFDGLPPRKRGQTYFDDGPYCGARFQDQYRLQVQQQLQQDTNSQFISLEDCNHQESISQQRFLHH